MDAKTKNEIRAFAKFWKLQPGTVRIYLKVNYPGDAQENIRKAVMKNVRENKEPIDKSSIIDALQKSEKLE